MHSRLNMQDPDYNNITDAKELINSGRWIESTIPINTGDCQFNLGLRYLKRP